MRPIGRASTLCTALTVLALLPSCSSRDTGDSGSAPSTSAPAPMTSTTTAAVAAPPTTRTKNWFDLAVGDCLTEIPAIEVGAVTTTVVDCTTPHQAEVYLLAPLKVDTAVDQIAGEKCAQGFVNYTGQPVNGSPLRVSYVIDSNQDRTANNPTPSTAICFLQAASGEPLTKSARS
ncbi:MAG: hypothetical protein ACXVGO_02885 [Mycobacterium sp.]